MAPESNATDAAADRPSAGSRIHSGLENMLLPVPASIVKRSRARPAATPLMDRSVSSSMGDSFMLEHWGPTRSPQPEADSGSIVMHASKEEDGLTPISNWTHLSYMKTQRNSLRAELKAQQIAGAEVKRSVTSLRRLAFRMAVNISVKEKQIATSARNLANSRKGNYLQGKDAEQRIEGLRRALRVEECRNAEILGALEKASMLTLEYSTPKPEAPKRQLYSPPPSPPTRNSDLPGSPFASPRTPTRPSAWHDFDLGLTPGLASPNEVRTSDSRLIRAKRESDQALAACRSRIEALQDECKRNRDDAKFLETTKTGLEQEIAGHQSRIATLERSRAAAEDTFQATQRQLEAVKESEESLKRRLLDQDVQIANLQGRSQESDDAINSLQSEKSALEERLHSRDSQLQQLESHVAELTRTLNTLQLQLDTAERQESSLRDRLAEKESACEDLRKRHDRGSKYIGLLEQKVEAYENEIAQNKEFVQSRDSENAELRSHVKEVEDQKKNTEDALNAMKSEVASLETRLRTESMSQDELRAELDTARNIKDDMSERLRDVQETLKSEDVAKAQLQTELTTLHASHDRLNAQLHMAQERIWSLEETNDDAHARLETLRDGKAALEADLKDARQSLFQLRGKVRIGASELADVVAARAELEKSLQKSESRANSLEGELAAARGFSEVNERQHAVAMQERNAQLRELEGTVLELQTALSSSTTLKDTLQRELTQAQESKRQTQEQLNDALEAQKTLKVELAELQPKLSGLTLERESLKGTSDQLVVELENSRKIEADFEARLSTLTLESTSLKETISGLEEALKSNESAKTEAEKALAIARLDGDASATEIADLHGRLNDMKSAKENANSQLHGALDSVSQLQRQHELSLLRLGDLEREVVDVHLQLSEAQEAVARLETSKAEAEVRAQKTQQSHSELEADLKTSELQLHSVEIKVRALQSSLASVEEEVEALHRAKVAQESRLTQAAGDNLNLQRELQLARQSAADHETQLSGVMGSNVSLQIDLAAKQAIIEQTEKHNTSLSAELEQAKETSQQLQTLRSSLEKKFEGALTIVDSLNKDVLLSQSRVQEAELHQATLVTKLSEANTALLILRDTVANLEDKLQSAESASEFSEDKASELKTQLSKQEEAQSGLAAQLLASEAEVAQLRSVHTGLETQLRSSLQHTEELESALRAAHIQIDVAHRETSDARNDLHGSKVEIEHLREANSKLEDSEKDLLVRLASAEKDLGVVRETNARLEAFLGRVEVDMVAAEAAVSASEKRLEEFVQDSQSKMEAARLEKLKYKRRLSSRNNELETLAKENANLHEQVGEQTAKLSGLQKGKAKLVQDLSEKDRYITEISSSSEKRLKSMHSAYNELRKKHKELENASWNSSPKEQPSSATNHDFAVTELEQKVRDLEDDKKALARLVQTLKEKVHGLEVLGEWQGAHEADEPTSPTGRHVTILDYTSHSAASSPQTQHTTSSPPGSLHSQPTSVGQPSVVNDRPVTRQSDISHDEDLDAWAKEVERVRLLRDETAVQLRDLKKSQHHLKKSLKDTEAQLHRLEKQQSPKRHRVLLRKSRPSTPFGMYTDSDDYSGPESPQRPATSAGFHLSPDPQASRAPTGLATPGSITRANTSSPRTHHRRWSMMPRPITPDPGMHEPVTAQRPTTSHSIMHMLGHQSSSSDGEHAQDRPKEKRRWSSGLRTFFRAD